jgi:sugar-specific transcriptional regulator TrmB
MEAIESLMKMGLSEAEAKVYLAASRLGPALYSAVAKEAGVKRPTLYYEVLPNLLRKGLLAETVKGKRRYLMAQDLQPYLDIKKHQLAELEELVPQLRTLLAASSSKPELILYEGVAGIKKVWFDHLVQRQPILEFVGIDNIHPDLELYIKHRYIIERSKRRIPLQMLISGATVAGIFKVKSDPYELREVKTINGSLFPIPLGCDIYGNNVSFTLHRADSEPIGLIIRSPEIATMMRSIFSLVWTNAK